MAGAARCARASKVRDAVEEDERERGRSQERVEDRARGIGALVGLVARVEAAAAVRARVGASARREEAGALAVAVLLGEDADLRHTCRLTN